MSCEGASADARQDPDHYHLPTMNESMRGDGYAVSSLEAMGEGYGFRKIRRELDVTAFGINALVLAPGYETGVHYHDEQEETYFVHRGKVEIRFGDGSAHRLGPGGMARVDAGTHRSLCNVGDGDAVVVVAGGKDGYVGRDGQAVGGSGRAGPPGSR
jgi:mannose-6-phosphate isomerase-like protein (cupin superfamily)